MANTLKFGNGQWATGNGTALAYNDENANFKPLPFDFTRASSGTVVNQSGLIETVGSGIPRIDFLGNTKGALLLEPSRTNSVTYSQDFSNASWSTTNATVVSGVISPDGTSNAFTLSNTAANGIIQKAVTLTGLRNASIFAKKGTFKYLRLGVYGGTESYANFDLENGTVVSGLNATIENYGNGWFRCICHSADGTTGGIQIFASDNVNGAGTGVGSIQLYGCQVESGSYATSYIPTSGIAVTRVADACNQTVPDGVIGQTEGTVYWEINVETTVATGNENILNVDNGSGFGHTIYFIKSATGVISGEMYVSGVLQATFTKSNITKGVHKIAMGYANNNTSFFVDGVQVGVTDTSCTVPLMSRIQLGNGVFGQMVCLSNDVKLYNTRLSNAELASLTTI